MKPVFKYIFLSVLVIAVAGFFIFAISEKKTEEQKYRELFSRDYRILVPPLPSAMDFAGEKVPLDRYYVRESLDREITAVTFMHSSTIMMFKRANRWFPVIEPILKKNHIPDDFKYLVVAESNLSNAVSGAGAEGFWQFVKPTGIKYGLEITEEVDERYNVEKATQAACDFFRDSYEIFKSWTMVAASFNRGTEGVSKAIQNQNETCYYDLYFVEETSRYVYRILAMKELYLHPGKYGFFLRQADFYPQIPVTTVTVDTPVTDLAVFAAKMKITYRMLRELNPWIRRYNLPNKSGKTYQILLPNGGMPGISNLYRNIPESKIFFHDSLSPDRIH
ncbi:MAG: lytic transglycosylase domain-containing protein [Bacteroidota bacterium]|nr:lytic transglycosylase domain-containing protein [Bacteroidota bacterium]